MWIESEMNNAFGRRIARDMPMMPNAMRVCFYIADYVTRYSFCAAGILLVSGLCFIAEIISSSYFFGYKSLLSDHHFTPWVLPTFVVAILFMWVIPFILNFAVDSWYLKSRRTFKKVIAA